MITEVQLTTTTTAHVLCDQVSGGKLLISYKTPVAYISPDGELSITNVSWSNSTWKHIYKFMKKYTYKGEAKKESQYIFDALLQAFNILK